MPFAAILDTCVLYPAHLRDTLLRLAERGLYRALWSPDIVIELRRNLIEVIDPDAVDRLLDQMRVAFPEAEVTGYGPLIDELRCHPKDRHVLAAAVRSDAGAIVTFNIGDFPDDSVEPHDIEALHPDTFLLDPPRPATRRRPRRTGPPSSSESPRSENRARDPRRPRPCWNSGLRRRGATPHELIPHHHDAVSSAGQSLHAPRGSPLSIGAESAAIGVDGDPLDRGVEVAIVEVEPTGVPHHQSAPGGGGGFGRA